MSIFNELDLFVDRRYRSGTARKSSLHLSTSSSTSSFSSLLSEQSQMVVAAAVSSSTCAPQQQTPPFLQSAMKPVALSYYHHLYNEKLMNSTDKDNSRRCLQPALYKTTYAHHNVSSLGAHGMRHPTYASQMSDDLETALMNSSQVDMENPTTTTTTTTSTAAKKTFKNEFIPSTSSAAYRMSNANNNNNANNLNTNYSPTSTGSGESLGSNFSFIPPNDIKHVKFRQVFLLFYFIGKSTEFFLINGF